MTTKKNSNVQTILTTDKIITVTTDVKVVDRRIAWKDIKARVETDEYNNEAPWESCDGWEHDRQVLDWTDERFDNLRRARGHYFNNAHGEHGLITLTDKHVRDWGFNQDEFYHGASKQVSREMFAEVKRHNLKQLVKWYSEGWQWYIAIAEYGGMTESVDGIDDYDSAMETAEDELRGEVAFQLGERGYIIDNEPAPKVKSKVDLLRERIHRNLAYASGI